MSDVPDPRAKYRNLPAAPAAESLVAYEVLDEEDHPTPDQGIAACADGDGE